MATALRAGTQVALKEHVPSVVTSLKAVGHVPATNSMRLVIGLPLRNQSALDRLLADQNDSTSTNYHRWLTPGQFAERFGPTAEDYQKVIDYARRSGFKVAATSPNRLMVDVEAPAGTVEEALHVNLRIYPHPTEPRNFFAPDTEPSVDAGVPIEHIAGLDNYVLPHRLGSFKLTPLASTNGVTPYYTGSAPGGYFMGKDFRAAYVPGVTNTGKGQHIAIIDVGGLYYSNDILQYELAAGLSTNNVVTNIVATQDSYWEGTLTGSSTDDGEEALDICMAMSMAPDAVIMNYEGEAHDVFGKIASDNLAKQMTLSYGFGIDITIIHLFQQFQAQGQAMSQASGDGDSDLDGGTGLTGNPYVTIVGGTTLTTSSAGGPWSSETTWNWGGGGGSCGGISGYGIPDWQQGVATTTNLGSTIYRNYPDVAMPADGVYLISMNATSEGSVGGTSCASPLWAGFMALVNQQAASLGKSAVGFPNPALYALGKGPRAAYTNAFHDITTGNNFCPKNPTRFPATAGYDLCTGWGTPRGSNTITAMAGFGTNDFMYSVWPGGWSVVRGGTAVSWITISRMNGFTGSVTFSVSNLPAGVTASFNTATTATSNYLSVAVSSAAAAGTYPITVTGSSGSLVHTATANLIVVNPVPNTSPVSLSSHYNRSSFITDGRSFSTGADGGGSAYSATLANTTLSWNGILFTLGPANANDSIDCAGQVITLPAGSFNSLQLLGTGVDGVQSSQSFVVTYTDGSSDMLSQSFSDWAGPQYQAGESIVLNMPYRNSSGGTKDLNTSAAVYNYVLPVNQTKTVKTLTLPNNSDVVLLAATLANEPVPVSLAEFYDRPGIYDDHVTFTNPGTGGADGGGYAFSGTVIQGSLIWTNVLFSFGPPNSYNNTDSSGNVLSSTNLNVVSATNQTVPLPAGNYTLLRILATGVNGGGTAQPFVVKYTDGTSSTFNQSLSDWYNSSSYSGEVKAIGDYRNGSDGNSDQRNFYLYGYAFKLNDTKVTQSITLPNDDNVIVAAISLIPNWAPSFTLNPFTEASVTAGQSFAGTLATNATDLNGDSLTYGKVSGPSWLNISSAGVLSGVPVSTNVGTDTFVVSVKDTGGLSNTATMYIPVMAAPAIVPGAVVDPVNGFTLTWSGGVGPFEVEMSTNLADTNWVDVADGLTTNTLVILPTNPAVFFRIIGQ